MKLGSITIPRQKIALATSGDFKGSSELSSLFGLSSRDHTSDILEHQYSPIITTIIKNHLLKNPIFSIALQRSSDHSNWLFQEGISSLETCLQSRSS